MNEQFDNMVAQIEPLSPEAEALIFPVANTLTVTEAKRIIWARLWCKVPDSLCALAIGVLDASKPVVTYEPIDWDADYDSEEDDAAFEDAQAERSEKLQVAIERDVEFKNGGL